MIIMQKIEYFMDKWLTRIENMFVFLSSILLIGMVFIISLSVIGRYFFNEPFAWTMEISEYIMLFISLFTASWILNQAGHVRLDLLINLLPKSFQKITNVFTLSIAGGSSGILAWFSLAITIDYYERGIVLLKLIDMPQYIVMFPIFIGSLLLTNRFVVNILKELLNKEVEGT